MIGMRKMKKMKKMGKMNKKFGYGMGGYSPYY